MIDIRDMGRDFESRREKRREERQFAQPTAPQAPTAQAPRVSTGQPAPFSPVTPSIPIGGIPTPPPVAPATPEMGEFPYPEQWQTATDIYGELAGGMPAFTPEYMETAWAPYQRRGEEAGMQAREQAGLTGMRWGTPLAGQMENIWGGAAERFGSEMERMRMEDIWGQRGAMLGAAGGLGQLGGQYAQLPLTVSESMMRQGFTQQQMQQAELDKQREEWMRQQPEYSPWLQYQYGAATGIPTGPAQYQPSFGSQMLDVGSQMAMYNTLNPRVPKSPLGGGAYPGEWGQLR